MELLKDENVLEFFLENPVFSWLHIAPLLFCFKVVSFFFFFLGCFHLVDPKKQNWKLDPMKSIEMRRPTSVIAPCKLLSSEPNLNTEGLEEENKKRNFGHQRAKQQ